MCAHSIKTCGCVYNYTASMLCVCMHSHALWEGVHAHHRCACGHSHMLISSMHVFGHTHKPIIVHMGACTDIPCMLTFNHTYAFSVTCYTGELGDTGLFPVSPTCSAIPTGVQQFSSILACLHGVSVGSHGLRLSPSGLPRHHTPGTSPWGATKDF